MGTIPSDLSVQIEGIQKKDPKLYEILARLAKRVEGLEYEVFTAAIAQQSFVEPVGEVDIEPPINITVALTPTSIHLTWSPGDTLSRFYEIRRGTNWDTATYVVTTAATDIHLTPIAGTSHTFLFKAIDADNQRSIRLSQVVASIVAPSQPGINITVIDNNVLLTWNVPPSTFQIKLYEVYRGNALIGFREGTFTVVFERVPGTYTYGIIAEDIAGNKSLRAEVKAFVNQPPDYVLTESYLSNFGGTKVNVKAFTELLS
jgi:hypothetical protein